MEIQLQNWFRDRGVLASQLPSIAGTLVYEPTIRLFGRVTLRDCQIGAYSYVSPQTTMNGTSVGRYCSIGDRCTFGPSQHPVGWLTTSPISYRDVFSSGNGASASHAELSPVTIGNDVWIGATAAVMGGVTIGDGAIVAFGSVVTKDVAPYTIVAGVPARTIRLRFPAAVVEKLLASRWWRHDLVNARGEPIPWGDPLAALSKIETQAAVGEIVPIPSTRNRITATPDGKLTFGRID